MTADKRRERPVEYERFWYSQNSLSCAHTPSWTGTQPLQMIKTIKALAVRRRAELQFGLPVLFFLRSKYLSTGRRQGRPLLTVSSQSCLKLKCWACSFRSAMQWLTFLFLVPSALSSTLRCVLYQCLQLRIDSWNHQVVKPPHRNFCNVSSVCLNCVFNIFFCKRRQQTSGPFPWDRAPKYDPNTCACCLFLLHCMDWWVKEGFHLISHLDMTNLCLCHVKTPWPRSCFECRCHLYWGISHSERSLPLKFRRNLGPAFIFSSCVFNNRNIPDLLSCFKRSVLIPWSTTTSVLTWFRNVSRCRLDLQILSPHLETSRTRYRSWCQIRRHAFRGLRSPGLTGQDCMSVIFVGSPQSPHVAVFSTDVSI